MTTPHPAMLQLWTKYGKLPKKIQNRSAPKLTDSSKLSELAHRNFWFLIETTRCAFPSRPVPSVFCLSLDETWSILVLNLLLTHTHTLSYAHTTGGVV